jgi:hypothetical protein
VVVLRRHPRRVGEQGRARSAAGSPGEARRLASSRSARSAGSAEAGRRAARLVERLGRHIGEHLAVEGRRRCATGRTPSPGSVTVPTTVARTSQRSQRRSTSGEVGSGVDDGEHPLLGLRGHHLEGLHALLAARARRDVDVHAHPALGDAVSLVAHVRPAPPRSWMPTTRPASSRARHASISRFSSKGSPTCTAGACGLTALVEAGRRQHRHAADAVATGGRAQQHGEVARARRLAEHQPVHREQAQAEHVHEGVALVGLVEDHLAARRWERRPSCRTPRCPTRRPRRSTGLRASSSGPNRSGSMLAMGRAPMVKMSRRMPPPPWPHPGRARSPRGGCGSRCGWPRRCRRPRRSRRRSRPGPRAPRGPRWGSAEVESSGRLVGAVLRPHHRVHRELEVVRLNVPGSRTRDVGEAPSVSPKG